MLLKLQGTFLKNLKKGGAMKNQISLTAILIVSIVLLASETFAARTILTVPGLGKVEADMGRRQLVFTCYNPGRIPMEYSIWTPRHYKQSEAGGWAKPQFRPAVKRERLPHYVTFMVTISRYEKIGTAICRENDGRLGCQVLR